MNEPTDVSAVSAPGNTRNRARSWIFVLNNPEKWGFGSEVYMINLLESSGLKAASYIFQLEKGENGTPHYQGVVTWENQIEFNTLRGLCDAIHWEKCHKLKNQHMYCQKTEGRIKGPWSKNVKIMKEPKILTFDQLYDWEREIVNTINEDPDDRTIHWFWEKTGGKGKTTFCKYLVAKHGAYYVSGKSSDIKYAISSLEEMPNIIIWDVPRSQEGYVSWEAIESLKNGIFFSGKYESKMMMYDPPHVLCFANFEPELEKLSMDRWKVKNLV